MNLTIESRKNSLKVEVSTIGKNPVYNVGDRVKIIGSNDIFTVELVIEQQAYLLGNWVHSIKYTLRNTSNNTYLHEVDSRRIQPVSTDEIDLGDKIDVWLDAYNSLSEQEQMMNNGMFRELADMVMEKIRDRFK